MKLSVTHVSFFPLFPSCHPELVSGSLVKSLLNLAGEMPKQVLHDKTKSHIQP